jgi:hypothetical protein
MMNFIGWSWASWISETSEQGNPIRNGSSGQQTGMD